MEEIYEKTLLFDFYGELLTPHRREIYSAVVFDDMSLSEAAEAFGVSRQGIHDVVKKCDEALREYEDKLHLVESDLVETVYRGHVPPSAVRLFRQL